MPWFAYSCPLSGRNQSSEVPCYFTLLRWGCLEKCCIIYKGLWSKGGVKCGKSSGSCRDPLVQSSGISGVEHTRETKPHRSTGSSQAIRMSRQWFKSQVKNPLPTSRPFKTPLEGMHSPMGSDDAPLLHVCQSCSDWAVKARAWRETRHPPLHEHSCFPTDVGRGEKQMTPLLFQ